MLCLAAAQCDTIQWRVVPAYFVGVTTRPAHPPSWGEGEPDRVAGSSQRRTAKASKNALSGGGRRVLLDILAAPWGQGRSVMLMNGPKRVYTKLGP